MVNRTFGRGEVLYSSEELAFACGKKTNELSQYIN